METGVCLDRTSDPTSVRLRGHGDPKASKKRMGEVKALPALSAPSAGLPPAAPT